MNDEEKQKQRASVLAQKAAREARAAAKDASRAAKVATEPVVDAITEEVEDTAHKLEGTAEDLLEESKRINSHALFRMSVDMSQGFLGLAAALAAGAFAVSKFRGAAEWRKALMHTSIRPTGE